jgi:hypothetical protein
MNQDLPWRRVLVIAVATAAACAALVAATSRRRRRRTVRDAGDRSQIGSWENEGGNLPPVAGAADRGSTRTYRTALRPRMFAYSTPLWRNDWPRRPIASPHP